MLLAVPSGPLIDNPLVRFASTGNRAYTLTLLSSSKVNVRVKYPESEPSASSGAFTLRYGFQISSTPISIELSPDGDSSSQVHPSGKFVESTDRLQIPANLPVDRILGETVELSPGVILVGSVGISKLALYGLTTFNVVI